MGHLKHLDDPKPIFDPPKHILDPKPIFDPPPKHVWDPKPIFDPSTIYLKFIRDEMLIRRVWPGDPVKFDPAEGLLPFFLANPHQYAGANAPAQEAPKLTGEMYDAAIRQAEYQIESLKTQIDFLGKERDRLKNSEKTK